MNDSPLYRALYAYAESDAYPFHMPGHKRNTALLSQALPYHLDITEIDGFDDLHDPEGILLDLNNRLSALYRSRRSVAMVNGATGGILAGIAAAVRAGDKMLVARNCHRAVYNAVALVGAQPIYLYPPIDAETGIAGSIPPQAVAAAIHTHKDIRLCILTSPTYDGVLSNISDIAAVLHQQNIPLLVDEAHGAHLVCTPLHSLSAVEAGADLVIQSLHKTLPALTQTAVAHLCTDRIDANAFLQMRAIFETASPSYLLLASIAQCAAFLETQGRAAAKMHQTRLEAFSAQCESLCRLQVLCKGKDRLARHPAFFAFDDAKLPVITAGTDLDGAALLKRLRQDFRLEGEMAAVSYALLMTSFCDTDIGFSRLTEALHTIDAQCRAETRAPFPAVPVCPAVYTPQQAAAMQGSLHDLFSAAGKVSLESVWCYPPGIPLLMAGERLTPAAAEVLQTAAAHGLRIQTSGGKFPKIAVAD